MYKFSIESFLILIGLTSLVLSDRLYGTNYGSYGGAAQNHGPPAFGPDPSHGQAGASHGPAHGIISQCMSAGHCENEQGRFHIPQVGNKRCLVCKENHHNLGASGYSACYMPGSCVEDHLWKDGYWLWLIIPLLIFICCCIPCVWFCCYRDRGTKKTQKHEDKLPSNQSVGEKLPQYVVVNEQPPLCQHADMSCYPMLRSSCRQAACKSQITKPNPVTTTVCRQPTVRFNCSENAVDCPKSPGICLERQNFEPTCQRPQTQCSPRNLHVENLTTIRETTW